MFRWDGLAWAETPVEVPHGVRAVWIDTGGGAWAVGDDGGACRFDGASWTCAATGTTQDLYAVFGFSALDVWAVGAYGTALHYDGSDWTAFTTGSSDELTSVWGAASDDVWAAGDWGGSLYHYTGAAWEEVAVPGATQVYDVFGFAADDVWAVGYSGHVAHWDGATWTEFESNVYYQLYSVWGAASDDVWAVGEYGTLVHWDGAAWTEDPSVDDYYLTAVGGTAADDVWLVGTYSGVMYHNTGSGWTEVTNALTEEGIQLDDVVGTHEGALWVVDTTGRAHSRDGDRWTRHGFQSSEDAVVTDVSAAGTDDVWATVEEGLLLRFDGTSWRLYPAPGAGRLDAVHAPGAGQVRAAGDVLVSYDGSTLSRLADLSGLGEDARIVGMYGVSDLAVQMMLDGGALYQWNGVALDAVFSSSEYVTYSDAHFVGMDDLWAVGYQGAILRWDGTAVSRPASLTANNLVSVFATPDGHVFAGGGAGTILHRAPE